MQSLARGLKFCSAWAQVACVVLAHTESLVTFHGYFQSTLLNNTVQSFSEASRFLFMMFHLIVNNCSKNNVKMGIFQFNLYTLLQIHL